MRVHPWPILDWYADAPPNAPDERPQPEVGQPVVRVLPALRLLQLLPDSQDAKRDACDGSGDYRSAVGIERIAGPGRFERPI